MIDIIVMVAMNTAFKLTCKETVGMCSHGSEIKFVVGWRKNYQQTLHL